LLKENLKSLRKSLRVKTWKKFSRRWLNLLKGFGNFLLKELKELVRDPKILLGMIIVPLIMFPVLGAVMGYAVQSAQEQAVKATLVVVNNDGGEWSNAFISFLQKAGVKVLVENNTVLENGKVLELVSKYNTTQILEIPKGFSENVTAHFSNSSIKASLRFYGVFLGTSVFESVSSSIVDGLVSQFNRSNSSRRVVHGEINNC
jgi:ABC-2 type transport system permease protein